MKIQVPHMGEWMISRWTTRNPTIERTLAIRVVRTIGLVFHPGLLDLISLTTERANEPSLDLGSHLSTMLGPDGADTSPGYWHTPDHSQGMQPGYLTHKPLCALSTSAWWLAPSHTYYMGISHHGELPCVPSNGGGS